MKLFECQSCRQPLNFENTRCESCGRQLGYLAARETVTALQANDDGWIALAEPKGKYRHCLNAQHNVCNWLLPFDHGEQFCAACRHNRTIPDLSQPQNLARWRKLELAKHRLFYTLLKLRLPLATRPEDPEGLAFDFIADQEAGGRHMHVMTGHDSGLITINLAEADDPERERQRFEMGEAYRTLLGHFRHEIAHYYWARLVARSPYLAEFRNIFGDEQRNYAAALDKHYAEGPPTDWPEHFVSAYASSHPWEDFAETWAHYFHMVDTLETAGAFGLSLWPKVAKGVELAAKIDFDPHHAALDRVIEAWLPLTFAVNSINRSMGLLDLYPFVLAPPVIVKLAFVHRLIDTRSRVRSSDTGTIRAIVASIRRAVGSPETG
ncbi:MAG TPA: putative zinc-binding peptidase [Xanthobacteraceae bacterium]